MEESTFTFVLIPTDDGMELQNLTGTKSGGLENDALKVAAKSHFSRVPINKHSHSEQITKMLSENGTDMSQIPEDMLKSIYRSSETSLEIISLRLPSSKNGYKSLSVYCDADGLNKKYLINRRATELVHGCGHSSLIVYGDAFLGLAYDNEEEEWVRMSITSSEANINADWVKSCAKENAGKNLSSLTSSGNYAKLARQYGKTSTVSVPASNAETNPGKIIWTQTDDELEIRLRTSLSTTSKDVKVVMKTTSLQIVIKTVEPTDLDSIERRLVDGAQLFDRINVADSTWSLESNKEGKVLVITLAKATDSGIIWTDFLA